MQFFTEISSNTQLQSYMLLLTECVHDFQNKAYSLTFPIISTGELLVYDWTYKQIVADYSTPVADTATCLVRY